MILQALCGYYQRARNAPDEPIIEPGYEMNNVSAEIVIDEAGRVLSVNSLMVQKGKKLVPRQMVTPTRPKLTSAIDPSFLCEKVMYLFGIYKNEKGAMLRFEASARIHHEVLDGVDDIGAIALLSFLDARKPKSVQIDGIDTTILEKENVLVVFRLGGETKYLHERPAIQRAWEQYRAKKSQDAPLIQCLVTGETAPLARVHGNLSGFGADKPTLVGFNQDAFCSFGKIGLQGANAPVGERAAFEYVTALNMLLRDQRHRVNLAGDKLLFWAERDAALEEAVLCGLFEGDSDAAPVDALDAAQRDRIAGALEAIYRGGNPEDYELDEHVRFYLLGLSANKTRLVVRFFHESGFGELMGNLMDHYRGLAIDGAKRKFPSPYRILIETALERKRENVPNSLDAALMRSILTGAPYPSALFQAVLRRIRADGQVTALRAGILKAAVNRQQQKEVIKMALDPNERDTAYLLGRLFALMEKTQHDALGDVNSSIGDKYFNAALATPRMVFPVLDKLNRAHLGKLEKPGFLRNQIAQVYDMLPIERGEDDSWFFPESLDANGQGKFIGGYYHQRQALYTKRDKTGDAGSPDTGDEYQQVEGGR